MDWNIVIPVFTFILGLLGKIFYDLWHDNYIEQKQTRKEGLKKHFSDLDKIISPLADKLGGTFGELGEIMTIIKDKNGEVLYRTNIHGASWPYFEGGDYPELSKHFSGLTKDFDKLINDAHEHDDKLKEFEKELITCLNEKFDLQASATWYNPELPKLLRTELYEIVKEKQDKENPFRDRPTDWGLIDTTINEEGKAIVSIHHNSLVITEAESQANEFHNALSEILNSETLLNEMQDFYTNTEKLESKAQLLADKFDLIRKQYLEFGKILKRKKDCPTCKLIFD